MKSLEEYLCHLEGKGFQLEEDSIGFIYFGKHYTNAPDELVNTAIEMTLKAQKSFDGSFYLSLLERFMGNNIPNRKEAINYMKKSLHISI
ncbi:MULTISPECIES: DUF6123 family protein [Cytobacillus]|uniref:DUF6123 family protein n=1 Tax=Cytobacillus TaxID=2675230 RepID=UPI001CD3B641|nr:DUF6123 family protein [Cytobacillus kochii]MCA1027192.1 DUF6123 family protein [Cytobacillus kochii]MCM3320860.1 DUF6123 family protein [Cytobacillus kochii]MCM3344307.1 DUF6123 family protein [Cytobacillus kochii]MDM5208152.1 DUF6123 family protein [Cytobacillus kochii]